VSLIQDLQHSFRLLRRAPGFAAAALVTLALAIGANTAVFSVVYGVLLRPLPYADAGRLVILSEEHPGGAALVRTPRLSNLTFHAWKEGAATLDGIGAFSSQSFIIGLGGAVERVDGGTMSPAAFAFLGRPPALGRYFIETETVAGADRVVVLGHHFWRMRYDGDAGVIGRTLDVDGTAHEIVGVAPADFYFPDRDAQFWTPAIPPGVTSGGLQLMRAVARLKPGVTPAQAAVEGTAAARTVARPYAAELLFGKGGPVEVRVRTIANEVARDIKPALLLLLAAVGLVLLIACANVANLLLARGTMRGRELAVRAALGAGGGRLAQQLLTESLTIGVLGGLLGAGFAWGLIRSIPVWAPEGFPRLDDVRLDWRMLGAAAVLSLGAGALAGVLPAMRAARTAVSPALRRGDARSGAAGSGVRSLLLGVEAALSVMLLIGAGLLARSFVALVNVDPGYSSANVITARVYVTGAAATPERRAQLVRDLSQRLMIAPGVVAAGVSNMAPLGESSFVSGFAFGTNAAGERVMARALQYIVTPGYAEALGIRLVEGRLLEPADETASTQAMVVNQTFVRTYMNDGKPVVGRRYEGLLSDGKTPTEIVGVVGDVLKDGLDAKTQPEIYLAHGKASRITRELNIVVRTAGEPSTFAATLRDVVASVEPTAATARVGTLTSQIDRSVSEPRFATAILGMFAALALGIAATGLYGVLSYNVSQRRREIGIRAALGATRGSIMSMVLRQGLRVTFAGLGCGVLASAAGAAYLQPLLFGIQPLDLPSFITMPAILILVAVAACAVPALRAAATDPAITLRSE
jgi:putative ABC transport system permease protein